MIGCFLAFVVMGTLLFVTIGPWMLFLAAIGAILFATVFLVAMITGAEARRESGYDYSQDHFIVGALYVFGFLVLIILGIYGFYDFWF